MITTAVIAAAGRGTRMQHLTDHRPKHLIPVLGKPFLSFVLLSLHRAGIQRFVIVIGYQEQMMREFLETQPYDITIVNQNDAAHGRYGTAVVVEVALPEVSGAPFVFLNGDSVYSADVLQRAMVDDGFHRVFGTYHDDPGQYGVIEATSDGLLRRIVEKPIAPVCHVINVGVYAFQPDIATVLPSVVLSARGEYEIVDAVNVLAERGRVRVEHVQSGWAELGQPHDIPLVEQFIIDQGLSNI